MNIEELIKSRKDKLNLETPPPEIWDGIKKEWKKDKRFSWWKAAAILFIATSLGLLLHNLSLQDKVEELASLGDISDEYRKIETSYEARIADLESGIKISQVKSDEDLSWIFEELAILDEINLLYRQDIGKIDDEKITEVLIDYYEKKIRLLKKLELEIRRTNKFKNDEKDNTNSVNL